MLIMGVIGGSSAFIFSGARDVNKLLREEADSFALWLTDRMSRAQFEECNFKLSMSQEGTRNASFRLLWQGGTQHGKMEHYVTSRVRIFPQTQDLSKPCIFDGEWSSMTPALTVDVKPKPPDRGNTLYVVVSGAGCVTIRDRVK